MPIEPALKRAHPNRESRLVRCVANFRPPSPPCHVCAGNAFEDSEEPCCHAARTLCLPVRANSERHIRLKPYSMLHANFGSKLHHSILHGYTLPAASNCAQVGILSSVFSASETRSTSLPRSFLHAAQFILKGDFFGVHQASPPPLYHRVLRSLPCRPCSLPPLMLTCVYRRSIAPVPRVPMRAEHFLEVSKVGLPRGVTSGQRQRRSGARRWCTVEKGP